MGEATSPCAESTSPSQKFKYAVVRIPETSVIEFFALIASKGFSDVSFVANLSQCTLKADPNDQSDLPTSSNSRNEEKFEEAASTNESRQASPNLNLATAEQISIPPLIPSILLPQSTTMLPKVEVDDQKDSNIPSIGTTDILNSNIHADLLSNLFGKITQNGFGNLAPDWVNDVNLLTSGSSLDKVFNNGALQINSHHPYKQESTLQTRMKGWQREYIKDVINNGHYPSEEELKDIEQKCDLSRKQVLRFIAKRLVNPNRKPRVNHLVEKQKEIEERDHMMDTGTPHAAIETSTSTPIDV